MIVFFSPFSVQVLFCGLLVYLCCMMNILSLERTIFVCLRFVNMQAIGWDKNRSGWIWSIYGFFQNLFRESETRMHSKAEITGLVEWNVEIRIPEELLLFCCFILVRKHILQQVKSDPCSFLFRPFLVLECVRACVHGLQALSKHDQYHLVLCNDDNDDVESQSKIDKYSHTQTANKEKTKHVI